MSMYADYIKERLGDECIETEDGFATYRFIEPNSVYIVDIYVLPEKRRLNRASAITDMVVDRAIARGCTKLIGTVSMNAKTRDNALKAMLAYGFKLSAIGNDCIILEKDI